MRRLTVITTAAVLVMMTACQLQQQQNTAEEANAGEKETKVLPPLHLGAVHQVYPQQGFALLRMIGPIPPGGSVLISHPIDGSNSRMGNLIVSSEFNARGNIIAAEIRSGNVVKGDRVFMYRNILNNNADEEPTEEAPEEHPILDTVSDAEVEEAVRRETAAEQIPETPDADTVPELPENYPAQPPHTTTPSVEVPSYLDEIPDDIHDWD